MLLAIDASRLEPDNKTGVEYYSICLLRALALVIPSQVRVILYSRQPIQRHFKIWPNNWENKVLTWPPTWLWSQLRLASQTLIDKPDIFFIPSHIVPFFTLGRVVVTIHDISWREFPAGYSPLSYWYLKLTNWWAIKKASSIITISNYSKDKLINYYPAVKNKVFVTYLAPALSSGEQPIDDVKQPYFLAIGRIEAKKNLLILLKAFAELGGDQVSLYLVGKLGVGSREIIKEVKSNKQVKMFGWLDEAKANFLLKNAAGLVFPAHQEGFGMPVLEAWQAGVPVIASAAGSLPEIVGEAGLLINPKDVAGFTKAMTEVLTNQLLKNQLINRGKNRLANFSWAKTAKETWQILALTGSAPGKGLANATNHDFDFYE